ncbi:prolyl oligopeptidase family serine peptidase [Nakamurella deserti]|uniref:prolyl oligopeptidase family serine peptidase n=1 Tax=Nakamurella deserti TaxID=2164074 RepID=UPI003B82DEED
MTGAPARHRRALGHNERMDDPFLWLEDVTGDTALDWVRARNAETVSVWADDDTFRALEARVLAVLDTDARIPYVTPRGPHLYNFWKDAEHPRGLWRRTTLDAYRDGSPDWDVLIDVDALAAAENENWVWSSAQVLRPAQDRVLVSLSRGGADAVVVREFSLLRRAFVDPADGGFHLPEAKTDIGWIDDDTVYVGTDLGDGSLTDSGYPRLALRWRRGTPIGEAVTVFAGESADVAVSAWHDRTRGHERGFVSRAVDFFNSEQYLVGPDDALTRVDAPTDASLSVEREWLLIRLMTPWTVADTEYPAGALLAARFDDFLAGDRTLHVVFAPDAHTALHQYAWTRHHLLLVVLRDVASSVLVATPGPDGFTTAELTGLPPLTDIGVTATDPDAADELGDDAGDAFWLNASGYLTPASLLRGDLTDRAAPAVMRGTPAFFDAAGLRVDQYFATSEDGTAIPYFVVGRPEAGPGPTLLYGYGGFEISLTPAYSGAMGLAWLERGGTYVVANIRGGGEYGPAWHTQVLKAGRHKVHEDFAAVARDLVARGITTPDRLGAQGGSNGGLLMGIMLTRYPELFAALVCQVPLLDMRRFHLLLAGASWVAEYGDPDDPDAWASIATWSPYQNVAPDRASRPYPPVLITTSTRDDRVHPGHARKMAARLAETGQPVAYYENIEGGHGGAADNRQLAFKTALAYEFLWRQLSH